MRDGSSPNFSACARRGCRLFSALAAAFALATGPAAAFAATQYVNELGAATGWWSDDTRNALGLWLNGKKLTVPGYLGPSTAAGSLSADSQIAGQIGFGDFYPGSDSGDGVVRLWATEQAFGKASIGTWSHVVLTPPPELDLNLLAANSFFTTTASLASGFTASYRLYVDPAPTRRTPAFRLNFVLLQSGLVGTFVHFGSNVAADDWTTVDVDQASSFAVYVSGTGWIDDSAANPKTMAQWAVAHPEYFASGAYLFGVGFHLGSDQRQCYVGIDWLETSLLNEGERIDFGTYGFTIDSVFTQTKPKPASDLWSVEARMAVADGAALADDVLSNGITVAIDDSSASGAFVGDSKTFSAEECNQTSATNGVRCKSTDGSLLRFVPRPGNPNAFRSIIRVRKRDFEAPTLVGAPLVVTVTTTGALDTEARGRRCKTLLGGNKMLCTN